MYFNVLQNLRQEQIQFATIVLVFGFGFLFLFFTGEFLLLERTQIGSLSFVCLSQCQFSTKIPRSLSEQKRVRQRHTESYRLIFFLAFVQSPERTILLFK